jgi:hypothetical protein
VTDIQINHGEAFIAREEAPPKTVLEALCRVMRDLPGIDKGERNRDQGFNYRGIEQITAALQPLLARHGIVPRPRTLAREVQEITINQKPWTDTTVQVEYVLHGLNGPEDFAVFGPYWGVGRDNSDKGTVKAMRQCYKQLWIDALCIGDKTDDPDAVTPTRDAPAQQQEAPGMGSAIAEAFYKSADKAGVTRGMVDGWAQELAGVVSLPLVPRTHWNLLRDRYAVHLQEAKLSTAPVAQPVSSFPGGGEPAPSDQDSDPEAPASTGERDEPEGAPAAGAARLGARSRKAE